MLVRLITVAVVLAGTAPLVSFATPASALSGCGAGLTSVSLSAGYIECVDPNSGSVQQTIGSLDDDPPQLYQESGTLAAANGTGVTTAQAAGGAAMNGTAEDGSLTVLGEEAAETNPTAAAVIVGGLTGFQVGQQISSFACASGISLECTPTKNPNYAPNKDVPVVTNDPGMTQSTSVGTTGSTTTWSVAAGSTFSYDPSTNLVSGEMQIIGSVSPALTRQQINGVGYIEPDCQKPDGSFEYAYAWVAGGSSSDGTQESYDTANANYKGQPICPSGDSLYALLLVGPDSTYNGNNLSQPGPNSGVGIYMPVGSTHRPPATTTTPNPARAFVTRTTCTDGSGNATSTDSSPSASFTETDSTLPAYPASTACPSGSSLSGVEVIEITSGLPDKTIWGPLTIPSAVANANSVSNPCANSNCVLDLVKVGPSGTQTGDCFGGHGLCADWFTDPNKTSDYQCTYGPPGTSQVVDLSQCNVYSPTFDPSKQAAGDPYGDPATGADPGPSTTGSTNPGAASSGSSGTCFPTGWGAFNPLEWVLKPVECAMVWAFVPDSSTVTSFETSIETSYDSSVIGTWTGGLTGIGTGISVPGSNSCGGMTLHVPDLGVLKMGGDYDVFDTCVEPWHSIALVVYAFLVMMIAWYTILAVFRIVSASFGLNVPNGD